jgi:antitoxin HicB
MAKQKKERLTYPVIVRALDEEEGGGFLAEVPDLPGCQSDGDTPEAAVESVRDAIKAWIATAKRIGRTVPEPDRSRYSGKWVQRVPKSLHKKLAQEARREGVSLNTLAATLLAEGLGVRAKPRKVA